MLTDNVVGDWFKGLELISLDFARPVYHELGVGVHCEETLRGIVRDGLIGRYSENNEPLTVESISDRQRAYACCLLPFLTRAHLILGAGDFRRLEHWVAFVANKEARNPWVIYDDVFSSWASLFRRKGIDSFGLSNGAQTIAKQFQSASDVGAVTELLTRQTARFLSDWDFPRFDRLGLSEIPEGSDFFPFVDSLILTIRMNRFQHFWRWMLSVIEADDLGRIADAALKRSEAGGAFCAPGELPLPADATATELQASGLSSPFLPYGAA